MYLFHWPVTMYWILLRKGPDAFNAEGSRFPMSQAMHQEIAWWEFIIIVSMTTLLAMFIEKVLNPPLTSLFMRVIAPFFSCSRGAQNPYGSTLAIVVQTIRDTSGADVSGSTP